VFVWALVAEVWSFTINLIGVSTNSKWSGGRCKPIVGCFVYRSRTFWTKTWIVEESATCYWATSRIGDGEVAIITSIKCSWNYYTRTTCTSKRNNFVCGNNTSRTLNCKCIGALWVLFSKEWSNCSTRTVIFAFEAEIDSITCFTLAWGLKCNKTSVWIHNLCDEGAFIRRWRATPAISLQYGAFLDLTVFTIRGGE